MKRAKTPGRTDLGCVGDGETWQEMAENRNSVLETFI